MVREEEDGEELLSLLDVMEENKSVLGASAKEISELTEGPVEISEQEPNGGGGGRKTSMPGCCRELSALSDSIARL